MKKLLTCSLILIASFHALAQNFVPGYIITLESDTIRGEIKYEGKKNYEQCKFKENGITTTYTTKQILGFGFNGIREYRVKNELVENSFLEVVSTGTISLYSYNAIFYLIKEGIEPQLLQEIESTSVKNGLEVVEKSKQWKRILSYLVSDCLEEPVNQKRLTFNSKAIQKIVNKYNMCTGNYTPGIEKDLSTPGIEKDLSLIRVKGGIFTGICVNTFEEGPLAIPEEEKMNSVIGASIILSSPRLSYNLAIQADVVFNQPIYFKRYTGNENIGFTGSFTDTYYSVKMYSIPLLLSYRIPLNQFSINLQGGLNFNIDNGSKIERFRQQSSGTSLVSNRLTDVTSGNVSKKYNGFALGFSFMRQFPLFDAGLRFRYYETSNFYAVRGFDRIPSKFQKMNFTLTIQTK